MSNSAFVEEPSKDDTVTEVVDSVSLSEENDLNNEVSYFSTKMENEQNSSRTGNYILTLGKVNSGKSTLQQHIVTWFKQKGNCETRFHPADGDMQRVAWLNSVVEQQQAGNFPERTRKGEMQEFEISVKPLSPKLKELTFGFFEISGEDIDVRPKSDGSNSSVPDYLYYFLGNDNINFSIVLISDASNYKSTSPSSSEDNFFVSFIDYVDTTFNANNIIDAPILLVLSKWDEASNSYRNNKGDYLKNNLPQTYARLLGRKKKNILINIVTHTVGRVKEKENLKSNDVAGTSSYEIVKSDDSSTEKISQWIYKSFTKTNLLQKNNNFIHKITKWI